MERDVVVGAVCDEIDVIGGEMLGVRWVAYEKTINTMISSNKMMVVEW